MAKNHFPSNTLIFGPFHIVRLNSVKISKKYLGHLFLIPTVFYHVEIISTVELQRSQFESFSSYIFDIRIRMSRFLQLFRTSFTGSFAPPRDFRQDQVTSVKSAIR